MGLSAPRPRLAEALRCYVRVLSGFQKEALVISDRTGLAWRFVSDEGASLSGYDMAPSPLAFLTTGMISSYMNEITALAAQRGVSLRKLRLIQDNYYTIKGSMRKRTAISGALPVELEVEVECDLSNSELTGLLSDAIHASPLNGLMRGQLPSLFTLSKNGQQIDTGEAQRLEKQIEVMPEPGELEVVPSDLELMRRGGISPVKDVAMVTRAPGSSLADEQDRILNLSAICTLREDGVKDIEQRQYNPNGTIFRFYSEEAGEIGQGRAPDAASYISVGIGFCFMTQLGRMTSMEKLNLPDYAIVQDTHFSLGGASSRTGAPGAALPVETHVHLTTTECDSCARDMLDMSEKTCFLHAFCRTDLKTKLKITRV